MTCVRRHRVQTWDRRGGILGIGPTPRNGDSVMKHTTWKMRHRRSCMCWRHKHTSLAPSPCAVESHPTPGDSRGSSSPSRSISRIPSHVVDGGSARIPLECVQPSLSLSSSLSRSIHSPEHHVIFHPSCSHHVSKVA